jgi:hypothetical protein
MKKFKKKTLLVGEGVHQHTLYGEFVMDSESEGFVTIQVTKDSELRHEKPNENWSNEHKTLIIDKGNWVMGKQVQYNPFNQRVERVLD